MHDEGPRHKNRAVATRYSSAMARFMSPDWAAKPAAVPYANYGNPQSLNLYAYVEDNPTTTADLDGHCGAPGTPNDNCGAANTLTTGIKNPTVGACANPGASACPTDTTAGASQEPDQKDATQEAQQQNIRRVGNIVDNETSGLRPSKTSDGSAQDLHSAKVDVAHVVINREKAGINGGVASDATTSREQRTPQYRDAQAAAAEAAHSPDPTHGSHNYVLDYGQRMPAWVGKMQTVQRFGPFVNGAGGGDVPRGAQVIIRILVPKPED